jgi:hypothetical protein
MSIPSFLQLERLCLRAWPALEEMDYDGWRLRAAQGYIGRANSVAPLAHGGLPVAEKIAHVEAWYTARQLPAKFRLTEFARPGTLDLHLRSLGYRSVDPVAAMTLALSARPETTAAIDLSLDDWFAGKDVPVGKPMACSRAGLWACSKTAGWASSIFPFVNHNGGAGLGGS